MTGKGTHEGQYVVPWSGNVETFLFLSDLAQFPAMMSGFVLRLGCWRGACYLIQGHCPINTPLGMKVSQMILLFLKTIDTVKII